MTTAQVELQFKKLYPGLFEDEDYITLREKYDDTKITNFFNEKVNSKYIKEVIDSRKFTDYINEFSKYLAKVTFLSTFERIAMRNYFNNMDNHLDFLIALYDLSININKETFSNMEIVLERYKYEENNANIAKWPVIAAICYYLDENYYPVKPTTVKKIAALLDYDIDYKPLPNFETYTKINAMYKKFQDECSICSNRRDVHGILYTVVNFSQ